MIFIKRLSLFQQQFLLMNSNFLWIPNCYPGLESYQPRHQCPEAASLAQHLAELQEKHQTLAEDYQTLKLEYQALLQKSSSKRKVSRRPQTEIVRSHPCPYPQCKKDYASELALNLHLKQKHMAGTMKQRQTIAKKLIRCELEGRQPPKETIRLPPGYLQKNRVRLMLMVSDSESGTEPLKQENSP